jgi:esterase
MQLAFKKLGSGQPLIILHGLYGSGDNWYSVGKELSRQFEVYLVDQRNHGKSPHDNEHSYQSMQKDLLDFYISMNIEKAVLIGHSMGGKTAMLFSLLHPERIEKLIIVDIAPKAYKNLLEYQSITIQHLNILQAFKSVDLTASQSRQQIEKEFSRFVSDPVTSKFLLKNLKRKKDDSFQWILNLEALSKYLPQMLDNIKIDIKKNDKALFNFQTLFVKGENSNYIMEEDKLPIQKLFPNAEFVTIFNAGHMVHAEQPLPFIESLKYFLRVK